MKTKGPTNFSSVGLCPLHNKWLALFQQIIDDWLKITNFLSGRYDEGDMQTIAEAEVVITPKGEVLMSSTNPLR